MATNNIFKTSGISARERKLLTINDFGGVDYMANPLAVANSRAVEIKNFIKRDGVNQKRRGWIQISSIRDEDGNPLTIRNLWKFIGSYEDGSWKTENIVAYTSNGKFWTPMNDAGLKVDSSKYEQIKWREIYIWNSNGENVELNLPDKELQAFVSKNKLYILTGVKYLICYLSPEANNLRITLAEDPYEIQAYIPTVLTGVPKKPTPLDDFNLLTSKIKVKGTFYTEKDVETGNAHDEFNEYELSLTPNFISAYRFNNNTETANEAFDDLQEIISNRNYPSFPNIQIAYGNNKVNLNKLVFRQNLRADDQNPIFDAYTSFSIEDIDAFTEDYWFSIGAGGENHREIIFGYEDLSGQFFLYNDKTTGKAVLQVVDHLDGADFEVIYDTGKSNPAVINKCTFGCLYGNNNGNTLFVSGDPSNKNIDYHTSGGLGDFTYFSDLDYCAYGTPLTAVKGYNVMNDGQLCVLKEESSQEPTIYFRTSTMMTATAYDGSIATDLNGNVLTEEQFPLTTGNIGEGLINTNSFKTFVQDTVFLSKNGLFGITIGSNVNSNVKTTRERSRFVNPRLTNCDLENAAVCIHNNQYFIGVKDTEGTVYIADSRYKTELTDDLYTWQYEWWVWKNVHVENFFTIDGKLYFSKRDGSLNLFTDDSFVDTKVIDKASVSFDFTTDDDIGLSDDLPADATHIYINNATLNTEDEELNKFLPINVIKDDEGNATNEFQIIDEDGNPINIASATYESGDSIKVQFISQVPVECLYQTVPFSFGTTLHSKYLYSYSLTNNTIEGSKYSLGIRTSDVLFNPYADIQDYGSEVNFEYFSFMDVSFSKKDFARSYNFKYRVPNINFAQFLFWNNSFENCSVSSLQLLYTVGLVQKGVR